MSPAKTEEEAPENGVVEESSVASDAPPASAESAESSPANTFVENESVEASVEAGADADEDGATPEEELQGNEAVEHELRELLGKMEESYKDFSETVFKKSTSSTRRLCALILAVLHPSNTSASCNFYRSGLDAREDCDARRIRR